MEPRQYKVVAGAHSRDRKAWKQRGSEQYSRDKTQDLSCVAAKMGIIHWDRISGACLTMQDKE